MVYLKFCVLNDLKELELVLEIKVKNFDEVIFLGYYYFFEKLKKNNQYIEIFYILILFSNFKINIRNKLQIIEFKMRYYFYELFLLYYKIIVYYILLKYFILYLVLI